MSLQQDTSTNEESSQTSQGSIEDLATVAADSIPLGKDREEKKKVFEQLSRRLNVTEKTRITAWSLLSRVVDDWTPENGNTLVASIFYLSSKIEGKGQGISLTQLLKETNIKLIDFFEPLKSCIAALQLGTQHEEQLKLLEKKFVVISILYQKYEKLIEQLFEQPIITPSEKISKKNSSIYSNIVSFGWTLFIVSKGKLLNDDPPDLLNAFHVLLCCIHLLYTHVPNNLRKLPYQENNIGVNNNNNNNNNNNSNNNNNGSALALLCELSNANYADVYKVHEELFMPYLLMLKKNNILKLNENADPKSFQFTGLLDTYLINNKQDINKEYDIMYYDTPSDLDERLFIEQKEQIGTPSKVPSQTRNYYHLKSKQQQQGIQGVQAQLNNMENSGNGTIISNITSPISSNNGRNNVYDSNNNIMSPYKQFLMSPLHNNNNNINIINNNNNNNNVPQSPMSTTLQTVSILKNIVSDQTMEPTNNLQRFYKACNVDVTTSINNRIQKLSELVQIDLNEELHDRIELAIKLYNRILEHMLLAEEQRLKNDNFTTLLNHENFHKSLFACTMEIVLFSYKMNHMSFPYIIIKFEIKSFDFCKIIESVIKHEPELPRVIIKHLSTIEEKILESMAWERGSPLISLLSDEQNHHNIAQQLLSPKKDNSKGLSSVLASPGPSKSNENTTTTINGNSSNSNGGTNTRISHSLELFFRKIIHLASLRSKDLCCRLQIPPRIFQQVWHAILHILSQKSYLLFNRHLDQIIMCCLYGVCRVNQIKDTTFKNIIEQYKSQPQSTSKVYREVFINTNNYADIISFYNSTFIPEMENFLLLFQQQQQQQQQQIQQLQNNNTNGSNNNDNDSQPFSPSKYTMNSPKVVTNMNLYLSPMRQQQNRSLAEHNHNNSNLETHPNLIASNTSKFLYSFGESPAKELRSINVSINSPKSAGKSKPKRLLFTENPDAEVPSPVQESSTLKRRHEEMGGIVNTTTTTTTTNNNNNSNSSNSEETSPKRTNNSNASL